MPPSSWRGRTHPRPEESPGSRPALPGWKIAYPMLSADGTALGFNGVALGRSQVYGTVAEAVCVQSPRHRCPSTWCDCGFYCFHEAEQARALACDEQYERSVLLEVLASGRYVSYELGLRYQRQTVRAVRVGRCRCGRAAAALDDVGGGIVGWRRLEAVCRECAGRRAVLSLDRLGRLAGVPVTVDEGVERTVLAPLAPLEAAGPDDPAAADLPPEAEIPLLSAEVTLLQARLDEVQRRLSKLTERG
ncbi:hypothetical protein [Actinomycetospora termitidis]|uniref:Uncharacterized protein n=1 Tax=Actinomycetospora termitidis TaxID=3053470 RepID=A0ABT7MFQ8_9PSEU|nr:hypothetical protein [Actinomycetospora sp. Odt1-22]MDL5159504.1 hypothetical protein [Actinomycetospora sp. Odt1-22]